MSRYIQDDLRQVLSARESGLAQVRGLADQLGQARTAYGTALTNYDVEGAASALVKIQVLEAMVARAEAAVPQVGHGDVVRSVSVAHGDLVMARRELQEAAQGVDADAFADKELRRVLATGIGGEVPSYAAPAAERIREFVVGVRGALAEIDALSMKLNNLKLEDLNNISGILLQAEQAADRARRLAGEAQGVRQAIAEANAAYMGVTAQ